ncbi:MAG: hypothetical protein PUP46_06880 [Endozoicomonas sp. (ex Botrylloides leachii)]|nr:hypothetical protein [Endozoicomonas sp. (ex Botrylloides leachii)]
MLSTIIRLCSWIIVAWIAKIFLFSLPYKFSGHPDTVHIFSTIGQWIGDVFNQEIGAWFTQYGAIAVGATELIVSMVLLIPIILLFLSKLFDYKPVVDVRWFHCLGGFAASIIMLGAVFFHLASPLGIVVQHEGKEDGGSLFYSAVSILILGMVIAIANYSLIKNKVNVSW